MIAFAAGNIFMKASTDSGIGIAYYLFCSALALIILGLIIMIFWPDKNISWQSGGFAFGATFLWGCGVACITIALQHFGAPLSKITPLFNVNTLFTVLLALIIFAEWQQVKSLQLIAGSVLIVAGSVLVTRA